MSLELYSQWGSELVSHANSILLKNHPGSSNARSIALIDGPPDLSHECFLNANIEVNTSLIDNENAEGKLHGTSVASTLVGSGDATLGLCSSHSLICIPVIDAGLLNNTLGIAKIDLRLARAVTLATKYQVDVIQMSLEINPNDGMCFNQLISAIQFASRKGIRIVVSAGNSGRLGHNKVLDAVGIVPVSAAQFRTAGVFTTNLGITIARKGFLAPAKDIPVAIPANKYTLASGSSYAATFITAGYVQTCAYTNSRADAWSLIYESHEVARNKHSLLPPIFDMRLVQAYLQNQLHKLQYYGCVNTYG